MGSLRGAHKNWSSLLFSHHLATFSQLRQLLLESQSQLDAAKSEAQKQSDELALVSGRGVTTCGGAGYACSHTQSEGTWVGCWHVCSTLGLWLPGPRCGPGPGGPLPCFAPLSPACTTSLRSHWAPCHWPCSEWNVCTRPVWAPRGSLSCSLTWVRGLGAGLLPPENLQGSPHRPRSSEQVPRGTVAAKSACGPPGGLRASSRVSAQTQPPCSRSDSS